MSLIHLLLNLAALLLWATGCGLGRDTPPRTPLTLAGNLKPTAVSHRKRFGYFVALFGVLLVRSVFYHHLGTTLEWTPVWSPGALAVAFRSDVFVRMATYSGISFLWLLVLWYGTLTFISGIHPRTGEIDPVAAAIRAHLGFISRLPRPIHMVVPWLIAGALWPAYRAIFTQQGLIPPGGGDVSPLWMQSIAVGMGAMLSLRWVISVLLILGLLNTYVYFGRHPFWAFVQASYDRLVFPVRWLPLRIFRIDLAPLFLVAALWAVTWVLWEGMPQSWRLRFQLAPKWQEPVLRRVYREGF